MSLAERAAARAGGGVRAFRNLPLTASVAVRHVGWDPAHAQLLALRALPTGVRTRVARSDDPVRRALAQAASGRRGDAVMTLKPLADRGGAGAITVPLRRLRRAVAAAAALDATDLAAQLLAKLPSDDDDRERLNALVAARRGDLLVAEQAANQAGARRLARGLHAQVAALTPRPLADRRPRTDEPACDVLHLVTNALPEVQAGYTVRTQGIAAAQRAAGQDVHVASRLGFPVTIGRVTAAAEVEVGGVPYHRLLPTRPLPGADDARLAADIRATGALVDRLRPAVLHAHSKHVNAQVALEVGRPRGLPVVYEVRGFLEETWRSRGGSAESDLYRLSREIETWCMREADAVVTLSHSMRDDVLARGLAADHVHVVPNAVDEAYLATPGDPAPVRARLGLPGNAVVLGVVSTLNEYEGLDVLVDAAGELRDRGAPVHLLIVGDGPARHALQQQARLLGLGEHATFTGRLPQARAREAHLAIDLFCVPRRSTPVTRLVPPLKPLEAMASGRPVIASDLPPLRETVDHGRTGLLVTPDDKSALADAVRPLLYDERTRQRMGQAARAWVLDNRTWQQAARWYEALYASLLHPQSPHPDDVPARDATSTSR